jgi:hypothetical protein
MLCECFGNMKKVEKIKIVDGKRVKTGIFRRICDRCAFDISEAQYQKMANKQIQSDTKLVCDCCGRIEHAPFDVGDKCCDCCGTFRAVD